MPRSDDTRARILDVALAETSRSGYGGLSIGKLADAAGMSKSGLFARFGGQDKLQLAIIEAAGEKFRREVIDPARTVSGARRRIEALAARWTDWLLDETLGRPCPLLQAAFEAPGLTKPAAEAACNMRREWTGYLERLARLAVREGAFKQSVDAKRFAFAFEGGGLALHSYAVTQDREDARALADAHFAMLIRTCTA